MKKAFIVLFISICASVVSDTHAARLYQTAQINALYGSAYWKPCAKGKTSVENDKPCLGNTAQNGGTGQCIPGKSHVTPTWGDEFGKVMMVARQANANGAYFCPTSITARNRRRSWAWTEYYTALGECVWLCKKGFTGEGCQASSAGTVVTCNSTELKQENYKNSVLTDYGSRSNIEDYIVMWGANYTDGCGSYGMEHDLIFAISNWTASGHGAFARPYMVRAAHDGSRDIISWIEIYPAASVQGNYDTVTEAKLYCKPGYKPNDNNTDCVAIDERVCNTSWCSNWDRYKFNEKLMTMIIPEVGESCLQWRCSKTTDALTSAGGTTCAECVKTAKDGVNPADGTCVHCGAGKFFDASVQGFCRDAEAKSKADLLYGPGKSKNSPIAEQCWTMTDTDEYKACVLGTAAPVKVTPKTINIDTSVLLRKLDTSMLKKQAVAAAAALQ